MPQLQPGQVVPGAQGAPKLYGTEKPQNNVPFQEKLMQLFKPQEFVTIKNITSDPIFWQYMPVENEQENFSEDGMQRQIVREQPEMWYIPANETDVLVGASAYRALDVMYKTYMASTTLKRFNDPSSPQFDEKGQHLPKNFNYADSGAQDRFIEQAYLGKATPVFGNAQQVVPQQVQPMVAAPQAQIQPMTPEPTATAPVDDPTIPKPKTTEGAPLAPVTYAEPDSADEPAKPKATANAGSKK